MEGSWLRVPGAGYTYRRQKQRNSDRRMGWITQEKGTRDKFCLGGMVFYNLRPQWAQRDPYTLDAKEEGLYI